MTKQMLAPNYLFEVSWEVCNKVGGIHTVISTKAISIRESLGDNHILIGPDVWRDTTENPEFEEDKSLFQTWKAQVSAEGLRIRIGRWKIAGSPIAIILDFTTLMGRKDEIFSKLWESYKLDSMSGQWDYVEPALFGYAAGMIIESYSNFYLNARTNILAQFHEWMMGAGVLYLKEHQPRIATAFTTHATVIGRSIAGNMLPLYSKLNEYDGDDKSNDFNVVSKQSLEKLAAQNADVFTTVSDLTAKECKQFLNKEVDFVTPNGFEDSFVPSGKDFDDKRKLARDLLLRVAEKITGKKPAEDAFLVATSGRYEYRNKGLDVFMDALGILKHEKGLKREIIAFCLIPAHHYGPRIDLLEALEKDIPADVSANCCLTHHLHNAEQDPVLKKVRDNGLLEENGNRVSMVFVPSYLQGDDGIFNIPYYDLLIGLDLTVFASYYEPWGYTPLESLAFKIPTVTTSLAGFGLWVRTEFGQVTNGITVVERNDENYNETVELIGSSILKTAGLTPEEFQNARDEAWKISRVALWKNLVDYYWKAYDKALSKAVKRSSLYFEKERPGFISGNIVASRPEWKKFAVKENIPKRLSALEEMSGNLFWSWDHEAADLFSTLDPDLWEESGHNPIILLKRLPLSRFNELEGNHDFMERLSMIHGKYKAYMDEKKNAVAPKVAYFSMEFGIHDSLKIYSGGLGLLAGDYLKEASDYNRDIVGIGILYRYGYFTQIVSASGEQIVANEPQDFSMVPAEPVRDDLGRWKTIGIQFPGRTVKARLWRVDVGRIELYLLDTDFEENMESDRSLTHFLYGGDEEHRLKQEILLGVGGIRALSELGILPDLYHCNEGHAAFIGLERLRLYIAENNLTFQEALEVVRASTLFTTHTPVPAGHDSFEEGLIRMYMPHYPDRLRITWDQFIGLGRLRAADALERFSMSYLAINLSQEINGVSRLHGRVTQEMFSELWKGYTPDELYIGYVTNGVHFPTWVAREALDLYQEVFGGDFLEHQSDRERWNKIYEVEDSRIWEMRNLLRDKLMQHIRSRLKKAMIRKMENPRTAMNVEDNLRSDVLTIGFARRFATYKRAHLLFGDLDRLARIVNNTDRPVQFIFAGKAHPRDKAGQDLIKMVVETSKRPEFIGRILFLQNYDIALAKKLVQGVDIWLNTPTRPLEASGTSGEKAVMSGCLHFSVLDGWWAEGYVEGAGWALEEERVYDNQNFQDALDAETIYSLLEDEIAPLYYKRNDEDVPADWVQVIKKSIANVAPNFTMNRMLIDYETKYYAKLYDRSAKMKMGGFGLAKDISTWKKIILKLWEDIEVVSFTHPDISSNSIALGESYEAEITLKLGNLSSEHVGVELVIPNYESSNGKPKKTYSREFDLVEQENGNSTYSVKVQPDRSGEFEYGIRIYARHPDLPHRQDFALVKWA